MPRRTSFTEAQRADTSTGMVTHAVATSVPASTTRALTTRVRHAEGVIHGISSSGSTARYPVSKCSMTVSDVSTTAAPNRRPSLTACHE